MEQTGGLTDYYVKPHKKVSRKVEEKDLPAVINDGEILFRLCSTPVGFFNGGLAVAHPQIDNEDPLRFFVMADGETIINPEILNHTNSFVDSKEGCLSFPENHKIIVQRYNKLEVRYQTLEGKGDLSKPKTESLSGKRAKIFQHEIDHFDAKYIF